MPKRIARWNPARDAWETEMTGLFCEHSDVFSETWPSSGTTRDGTAYELPMSGHLTDDSGSSSLLFDTPDTRPEAPNSGSNRVSQPAGLGNQVAALLPTPAAMNPNDGENVDTWEARRQRVMLTAANGNGFGTPLAIAVQLLPTPRTSDTNGAGQHGQGGPDLRTAIDLLPTPQTVDTQLACAADMRRDSPNLRAIAMLLPTPTTTQRGPDANLDTRAEAGPNLHNAVMLLPTPRSQNGEDRNSKIWARDLSQPQNLENALARLPGAPTNPLSADGNELPDALPLHPPNPALEADSA